MPSVLELVLVVAVLLLAGLMGLLVSRLRTLLPSQPADPALDRSADRPADQTADRTPDQASGRHAVPPAVTDHSGSAGHVGESLAGEATAQPPVGSWREKMLEQAPTEPGGAAEPEVSERQRAELLQQAHTEIRGQTEAELAELRSQAAVEAQATLDAAEKARTQMQAEVRAELDAARRQAEVDAAELAASARKAADQEASQITERAKSLVSELERREQRLTEREERIDAQHHRLEQRDLELTAAAQAQRERETELKDHESDQVRELERLAGLTAEQAKAELLSGLESQVKRESALLVRDLEAEARKDGEERARHIVVDAIQRVASEQTSESVVSVLHLPSDEMKGRIIGREGRNIRAFETTTGVNLIIDDTPEAVLLSCFDPVRREIARLTLEKLILDGRIHPHRIEEMHDRSRDEVERLCLRAGEDALVEVGITEIHPDLIALLGRLRYRTSYGQNVLKHLIETAHIAGIMASELRMNPATVKRGAFLHDIGKALTHEVEGSHALIGADLARKYGESDDVVHAIEAHHNEVPPQTIEAVLTQASDSCSGGRPGARRESLETYVKRLERIEEIASAKTGVDKVFAMQAGREVRVMVSPEEVDDVAAHLLARDVAKQIEEELTYPGQIRVTVVRESRATEIAH